MNANKMLCKSRFFISNANAFLQGCRCEMSIWCTCLLSEMQISWCRSPMRGCKCKVYPWWCQRTYLTVMQMSPYRDGDAKNLVVQMPSNGYVMMQMLLVGMSWCKCTLVVMQWCRCPLMGMPWCECPFVGMQWRECLPVGISWHKCFDANTLYSKIPFIFKTRLSQRLKPKCFQNLIYYSWKVIFFFT